MARNKRQQNPLGSLDTNVLLRLLLGDVPAHTRAIEELIDQGGVFEVSDAALIEMIFVLEKLYKMDRGLVQTNVFAITRHKQFLCNSKLFAYCMPLYTENPSLSIIDCALLVYARLQKATPLYTFDKDIIKRAEGDAKVPE